MKKVLVWVALFAVIMVSVSGVVSAKFATEDKALEAAYSCLVNATNKSSLSLEESIYTILALGYHNRSNATIGAEKSTGADCWPASGCTIKRTAQVGLAHDLIQRNTTGIENWIYTKNGTATEIEWFLEIDTNNQVPASCTIKNDADSSQNPVSIDSTQKMTGTPGNCFAFARDGYLLRINPACMDRTFEVKCNEDFLTAVIYKKTTSETYYISGETHTAVAEGTTNEKITSKCFRQDGRCDYEGTLWAALALQHFGRDVTQFMPYLIALADEAANVKFMPHAFLYMLTESDDSYNELTQSQQQSKFWRADTNNSRLYDTALGTWALAGTNSQEATNAKNYLLEVQESNGCWNNKNIRDTAFILYAAWAQPLVNGGTGDSRTPVTRLPSGRTNSSRTQCEQAGFSCTSAFSCLDAGGVMKGEYTCSGSNECCSTKPLERQTCSAQSGIVCSSSQRCDGRVGASSSGTCCFGSCVAAPISGSGDDGNECESSFYGTCKSTCNGEEYDSGFSCSTPGYLCCSSSSNSSPSSGSSSWIWWVILLLILCIAAVLGIIYKDQVRIWWFKITNKKHTPSAPAAGMMMPRPGTLIPRRIPSMGGFARPMPTSRPGMRPAPTRPASQRPQSAKNSDYEETLKKLREMSK